MHSAFFAVATQCFLHYAFLDKGKMTILGSVLPLVFGDKMSFRGHFGDLWARSLHKLPPFAACTTADAWFGKNLKTNSLLEGED